MDQQAFFMEATRRLSGHLKIEHGLQACITYLAKFMPADALYLEFWERGLSGIRFVARATNEYGEKMDVLAPLQANSLRALENAISRLRDGRIDPVIVINNPSREPVSRDIQSYLGIPPSSSLNLPLIIGGQSVGTLALIARGDNRYSDEHAALFGLLKEPFYVAMSNARKHQEVVRLKELLADENRHLHRELMHLAGTEIIGQDFGLKDTMDMVRRVAPMGSPVLLLGETGVGKDVIANAIHNSSPRRDGPFIKVNSGAIPPTLVDSELFGHEKGAFTGASVEKRGHFERADKGTIFLDEIGELPPEAQVRLLRVLQEKVIERVGGTRLLSVDIRIIAATHRDLKEMVRRGAFREDLWFRLSVFPLEIPPLRHRTKDLPALVAYFVGQKAKELGLRSDVELGPGAMDKLMDYDWPGNVRQLANVVERALILNRGEPLGVDQLILDDVERESPRSGRQAGENLKLDRVIAAHIKLVLEQTGGRINGGGGAAELLGVNPSTLRSRMQKLGIPYRRGKSDTS
jgi:transcriptional regulator with GAF, ATPase, and Fis domain